LRRRRRWNAGFSPVEVLIAIALFGLMAGGLAAGLARTSSSLGDARVQSVATNLATSALEDAQRMDYASVGTVGGSPAGAIVGDRSETVDGVAFRVQTAVTLAAASGTGATATGASKRVTVTVTPPGGAPITSSTVLAPRAAGTGGSTSDVVATIRDHIEQPVAGVSVTLTLDNVAAGTATTDAAGQVSFTGLAPSKVARVTVDPAVWLTEDADKPANLYRVLRGGRAWEPTIDVYRAHTVVASLVDSVSGAAVTESAAVTLTAPDGGTAAVSTTSGSVTFSQVADAGGANARVIKPSVAQSYSVSASADCYASAQRTFLVPSAGNTGTTQPVSIPMVRSSGGSITVTFRKGTNSGGAVIAGSPVTVSGGGPGLAAVTRTTSAAGTARFCVPPSGATPFTLSAGSGSYTVSATQAVANGNTLSVTMLEPGSIRLSGGLLNSNIRLRLMDGTLYAQKATLLGLTYADFHNVPPGSYRAAKQGLFGWGADTIVEVRSGEFRGPFSV
jgi:type II secretory pathway pseudopilin PulG